MSDSYFGRLFGRGSNSRIFSANIAESEGFDTPAPIPSLPGWTVWKKGQTEIYVITHNLELSDPTRQMHIVATPKNYNAILSISSVDRNEFTVSTWNFNGATTQSAFMFIAIYYPKAR